MFISALPTASLRQRARVLSTKNPLQSNVQVFGFAGAAKGIELTSAAKARNQRWRRARPQSRDSWQMATQAPGRISVEQALDQFPQLVAFLEACKELGELRFIATNAAVVFESTATLEKLFYAEVPRRGLYANIIDLSINLDLHILLSGIRAARFEQGASRGEPSTPTYIIRFLGHEKQGEEVVLSLFLSPVGEVSADRVALWERLRARFTSKDGPSANICVF